MEENVSVLEFKCPNCGGSISFSGTDQMLTCEYCDSTFTLEEIQNQHLASMQDGEDIFQWDAESEEEFSEEEQENVRVFTCPACGGQLMTDAQTVATFCPYCDNPAVLPQRASGGLRPDAVIPFRKTKKEAQEAFLNLCKGKKLLPKFFTSEQHIEKITGMYAPFWLYDCRGEEKARYEATRTHSWSDSRYNYVRTDHYSLIRGGEADFVGIPMDSSSKLANEVMESIEPYDYADLKPFDMAYLTGYLADKYDVEAKLGEERVRQRVSSTMDSALRSSCVGYTTVTSTGSQISVAHNRARYVLMPVWFLTTKYEGQLYTFAMNGQTGKMTGTFPVSKKRMAAWFAGICGAAAAIMTVAQFFFMGF